MSTTPAPTRPAGATRGHARKGKPRGARPPGHPPARSRRTRDVRPDEVLDRLDDSPAARRSYAATHRVFLLDALAQHPPATPADVMLAHSRATSRSWDVAGLHVEAASTVRLDVLDAVCTERGLDRQRGALRFEPWPDLDDETQDWDDPDGVLSSSRRGRRSRRSRAR